MWATYLRGTYETPNSERDPLIEFGEPLTFDTDTGIDDAAWSADLRTQPDAAVDQTKPSVLWDAG